MNTFDVSRGWLRIEIVVYTSEKWEHDETYKKHIAVSKQYKGRFWSVYFDQGSFWLTQKAMGELFGVDRSVIGKHLKNIFETGELEVDSVCAKIAHTAVDGKNYNTRF